MAIHYHFDPELKIIFAKGAGVVSLEDLLEYGKDMLSRTEDLAGAVEYVDLSAASDIAVSYNSAQQMLDLYRGWKDRGIKGSVLYAPSDFSYGIVRMISAVISSVSGAKTAGPIVTRTPIPPEQLHDWLARRDQAEQES